MKGSSVWTFLFLGVAGFAHSSPLAAFPGQERTLFQQVFRVPPKETNGYADYVRAADAVQANAVLGSLLAGEGDLTPLERNRRIAQEGKVALDLVRAGNRKPVEDPRTAVEIDTLFPELAGFKSVAKVAMADLSYRFAIGDSRGATDTFVEASKFVSRIPSTPTLISGLVMVACDSILLAPLEQNIGRVALLDLDRLEQVAKDRVASVEVMQRMMAGEARYLDKVTVESLGPLLAVDDDEEEADEARAIKAAFDALAPADRERLLLDVKKRARSTIARVIATLAEPESSWRLVQAPETPAKPSLADYLVETLIPIHTQALTAFAKNRTQWRLLRLHTRLERFRLVYGRLPYRLYEAAPADLITDPWNDGPFDYKVVSVRDYELTSKGDEFTGPIAIRYRRQPPPDDAKSEPPPR
ncbi:MAG: hypothetical protein KIS66_11360 [Fimbriimonadaceae bacterium]|nr:hypothetical protein [Fimbriimonadaceae bacterium]